MIYENIGSFFVLFSDIGLMLKTLKCPKPSGKL